jgi:broad specificity phosphatase PhoE
MSDQPFETSPLERVLATVQARFEKLGTKAEALAEMRAILAVAMENLADGTTLETAIEQHSDKLTGELNTAEQSLIRAAAYCRALESLRALRERVKFEAFRP